MSIDSPLRALAPAMLRLAGPVALARLGWMSMGVVDTIVVGQFAPHELAFLALGWAPTSVMLVTGMGLLTGVQVLGARAVGAGRPENAGAVWREGMVIAAIAGLGAAALLALFGAPLLRGLGIGADLATGAARVTSVLALSLPLHFAYSACASFLEAIKRPAAGAIAIWIANAINLALNLCLVPHFGALGAAYATIGARVFMLASMLGWIFLSAEARAHGAQCARVGPGGFSALLAVGAPSAISQLAEAGAFNIMSVIAARIGAQAVAAYQVLLSVLAVVFMVALGFSAAGGVMVSEAQGRGDNSGAARAGWTALGLNTIGMIVCAAILVIFAWPIARSFTSDAVLAALVASLLPLCAWVVAPDGGQSVMAQSLRGRGDNWFPSASHILAYTVLMPPLAYVLGERLGRGVEGLLQAIIIASAISVLLLSLRFAYLARVAAGVSAASRSPEPAAADAI